MQVSDYDKANGITAGAGGTAYETLVINKDKAVNEIIDGYDAQAVPDGIVAERLDSAAYSLAKQIDADGATVLLAGATVDGIASLTSANIYDKIVDVKVAMDKANVPNDGKRYLLVVPDAMGLILKDKDHFVKASDLGDAVVQTGAVGKIAGFLVIEWNDSTANLQMVAGHPRFATRAGEFSVPIKLQSLDGSGKYIGASAVQGRKVYGHKVLRSVAIRAIFAPSTTEITAVAQGTNAGDTKITATLASNNASGSLAYKVNPVSRIAYNTASTDYAGTAMTSGTAKNITSVAAGDVVEVAEFNASGNCISVAYVELKASDIK